MVDAVLVSSLFPMGFPSAAPQTKRLDMCSVLHLRACACLLFFLRSTKSFVIDDLACLLTFFFFCLVDVFFQGSAYVGGEEARFCAEIG